MSSTPKRRASEPSGASISSESQRVRSSNQATLGPTRVRTRVASSTVDRVWSANTTISTSVPAASPGASSDR
ncbi:Uncharacterised protein [Mycobacteroides abscessus subsp. abscessus]|nr:Uncharacterised protein [Mycobacteroides abscessus subsp. abscessus]